MSDDLTLPCQPGSILATGLRLTDEAAKAIPPGCHAAIVGTIENGVQRYAFVIKEGEHFRFSGWAEKPPGAKWGYGAAVVVAW
jgi:hypothetical protein